MSHSFLLVSWGSSGNLNPLLTAGRQLRRHGHHVRVMADPAMRDQVERAGFGFTTWRRAPIGNAADPADLANVADWLQRTLFGPAAAYAADIRDEISRVPTDAVLCLDALFGGLLGAEAAGIPFAVLSPHISIRPLPGLPPITSGLRQPRTPEERARAVEASAQYTDLFDEFLPVLNKVRRHLGLSDLAHVLELFDRADRFLLAVSRAFDFEADSLPNNVRYIGPLLDMPSWSNSWQAPWSSQADRPRVLITCSTGAQGQGDLVQRAINAVGMVEVDAVVTTGPNLPIAELRAPDNVHLLQGAPHDTIMQDVSLVISQGGHGTVSRALINGLPQLILPIARDQADNAARVEAKGAGLRLPASASLTEIAAAVNRLIREPHFRAAAGQLGSAIKADIEASCLVAEMEAIVRARGDAGL